MIHDLQGALSFIVIIIILFLILYNKSDENYRENITMRQFTNPVHSNVMYSKSVYNGPRDWIF